MNPNTPVVGRTPWKAILSILMALLYDVSPVDLIPDVIPLLGWIDDGMVTILMFGFGFAAWRRWAKARKKSLQTSPPTMIYRP